MSNIHKLIKSGSPAEIKKVLTSTNINIKDRDGQTPLHIASYEGRVQVVKLLLSKKVNNNGKICFRNNSTQQ